MSENLFTFIIPNWLTAIGTVSAVVISLYLSLRDRKFRYYSKANFGTFISDNGFSMDVFMIKIVNKSPRPVKVTSITWITRKFFVTKHYLQMPDENPFTDVLPKVLEDGQELNLYFKKEYFIKGVTTFDYKNFKLFFNTSANDQYPIKITKEARGEIKKLIKSKLNNNV